MTTTIAEADLELAWTQLPPGPELVLHLAMADWESLPDRELVAALEAADRQTAWAQSLKLTAVAELARRRQGPDYLLDSDTERRIAGEVSLALTATQGHAEELVWLAQTLPERLPATWAALRHGLIDYDRAKTMCDALGGLDPALARSLDTELIGDAAESTRTVLRRKLTKAIKTADPDAHAERARNAKDERRVEVWDNPESDTCDLVGRNIDATEAHAIYNRLTAAAQAMKTDGDLRTIDQIRLDLHNALLHGIPLLAAVRDLFTDGAPGRSVGNSAGPGTEPAEPIVHVAGGEGGSAAAVVAAAERVIAETLADIAGEQLTGLFDQARADGHLDRLPRLIRAAAQAMRDGLAGTVEAWCQATSHTTGTAAHRTGHGHPGYRPPAAMQRVIQRRHSTCVFPTCNRRSIHCDIDHTEPYDKGGRTCKCNLAPCCRTHHRIVKQHPDWTLIQIWPGLLIWVTPNGTWHIVTPQ